MRWIIRQFCDIARHRLADPYLQLFNKQMAGPEQAAGGLRSAAQRLTDIFARGRVKFIKVGSQRGVERINVFKTLRRRKIENLNQAVIAIQDFVLIGARHTPGSA